VTLLPFAGIATFARAPHATLGDGSGDGSGPGAGGDWRADAAVLGVPFDLAVGFRPGQRFAPRAVREASLRYALPPRASTTCARTACASRASRSATRAT
jgi:agmatinase